MEGMGGNIPQVEFPPQGRGCEANPHLKLPHRVWGKIKASVGLCNNSYTAQRGKESESFVIQIGHIGTVRCVARGPSQPQIGVMDYPVKRVEGGF